MTRIITQSRGKISVLTLDALLIILIAGVKFFELEDKNLPRIDGHDRKEFCATTRRLLRTELADRPRKNSSAAEGARQVRTAEIFHVTRQKVRARTDVENCRAKKLFAASERRRPEFQSRAVPAPTTRNDLRTDVQKF